MPEPSHTTVVEVSDLQRALGLKGFMGRALAKGIHRLLELDKVNDIQSRHSGLQGADFAQKVLEEVGVGFEIPEGQLENIPKEGAFITVSNHHYGSLDGLILCSVIARLRPDFKILTTYLLSLIPSLRDSFIPVDNFKSGDARSVSGIRAALSHISEGKAIAFFPAGEVATVQPKRLRTSVSGRKVVEDIPWADNIVKLIKKTGYPVVPVYFDGGNSRIFHLLGKIHPRLRTLRLIHEMFNKSGKTIQVRIGRPIQPSELAGLTLAETGRYLRARTYALQALCMPEKSAAEHHWGTQLVAAQPSDAINADIEKLKDRMLFETDGYRLYFFKSGEAPALMKEIYRLREGTFRSIGEGTGLALDTDNYDRYYRQLVLWHVGNEEVAGAYRIGFGPEIVSALGIGGIYSASLVRYSPLAADVLSKSMELGRSFVVPKYQREIHPLRLLFAGLSVATLQCPEATHFIGPVSISNDYPHFYKSMIVHFMSCCRPLEGADRIVRPTHPFVPDYMAVNPDDLLLGARGDVDRFNRLMGIISDSAYRVPVLIRKYINCGARTATFNVDPLFSNSLDALILCRLGDFPETTLMSFLRGLPEDLQRQVVNHFYGRDL